jgi:hypothetical protein
MTIANENNRVQYTATGGQTTFAYDFKIEDESEIAVYLTPNGSDPEYSTDKLTLTTDYTLTGVGNDAGGNIVLTAGSYPSGATAGDVVTAIRAIDMDQPDAYSVGQDHAEQLEASLDRMSMRIQRLEEELDRAIKVQPNTQIGESGVILPEPVGDYIIGWNSAGSAIINLQTIADKYFGQYSTPPITNPYTGGSLEAGDLYYDTTLSLMMVYNGATWGQINSSIATAANAVTVADAGGFYAGSDVEAVLGEIGPSKSRCIAYQSSGQSISNSTYTALAFDAEGVDDGGWHDNVTNNSRFTVPAGVTRIRFSVNLTFAANATGTRIIRILKNGSSLPSPFPIGMPTQEVVADGTSTAQHIQYVSAPFDVTPGDYFEIEVWQDSGGALSTTSAAGLYQTWACFEGC